MSYSNDLNEKEATKVGNVLAAIVSGKNLRPPRSRVKKLLTDALRRADSSSLSESAFVAEDVYV